MVSLFYICRMIYTNYKLLKIDLKPKPISCSIVQIIKKKLNDLFKMITIFKKNMICLYVFAFVSYLYVTNKLD